VSLHTTSLANCGLPPFADDPTRACADADPTLFFPEHGNRRGARRAKEICRRCPIRRPCLAWALPITDLDGVWGATGPGERRRLRARLDVRATRRQPGHREG
jgi:WhiB family redox-sensing transcriptional regulator